MDVVRVDVLPNAIYVCECVSKRGFIVRKRLKSSSVQKILLHNPIITDSLVQNMWFSSTSTNLMRQVLVLVCISDNVWEITLPNIYVFDYTFLSVAYHGIVVMHTFQKLRSSPSSVLGPSVQKSYVPWQRISNRTRVNTDTVMLRSPTLIWGWWTRGLGQTGKGKIRIAHLPSHRKMMMMGCSKLL